MNGEQIVRRLKAWAAGRPTPLGETLHIAIPDPDDDLLIVAFVRMGGESRPWGIAVGHPGQEPRIFTIAEPRNRELVAEMCSEFAPVFLEHLGHPSYEISGAREQPQILRQIWVPNATHVDMLHFLNYAYTFARKSENPGRLDRLNALGRACGWLFREAQRPGQMNLIVATEALRDAFTFPAEDTRQGHLGFLLAWLSTNGDRAARLQAGAEAERHAVATALDPDFEREELEPRVKVWGESSKAGDESRMQREAREIERMLSGELRERYKAVEQAIDRLRRDRRRRNAGLAELVSLSLSRHWRRYLELEWRLREDPDTKRFVPRAETDRTAATASAAFHELEAFAEYCDALLVHDDREMQQQLVAAGKAIDGTIVSVRDDGSGRKSRPVWSVESDGSLPLHLREGETLCLVGLRGREGRIRRMFRDRGRYLFEIDITKLITRPRGSDTSVPKANDRALEGRRILLVRPAYLDFAMRKIAKLRQRGVPGAWLTHARPAGAGAVALDLT